MTTQRVTTETSRIDEPVQPARRWLAGDILIAVGLIVFAAVTFYITTTFDRVPRALARGVQPADYPRFLVYVLVVLALLLAYQGFKKRSGPTGERPPLLALYTAVALVLAALAVPYLGVLISLFLLCAVLPPLWGQRNPIVVTAYAIGFPLIVYSLFSQVLGVRFPVGTLINLF